MPKNYFSNHDAFWTAVETTKKWYGWADEVQKRLGKNPENKYDHRNLYSLALLTIDMSNVPDNEKESYFKAEYEKMHQAFDPSDPNNPSRSDPQKVKPYIKKMFDSLKLPDLSKVDYNDPKQIQHIFHIMYATQMLATMVVDYPEEAMDLYPTHEDKRRIDSLSSKAYAIQLEARAEMSYQGLDEVGYHLNVGKNAQKSTGQIIKSEVVNAVFDSTLEGNDNLIIDPVANELSCKFFLGESFTVEDDLGGGPEDFTEENYAHYFSEHLSECLYNTSFEYQIYDPAVTKSTKIDQKDCLIINGKPFGQILEENRAKKMGWPKSEIEAGKVLREALINGEPVTLVSSSFTKDGEIKFFNKDIRLDLDKLNAQDRARYNIFRRALDTLRIWRIPQKYPTNKERDAKHSKILADPNSAHQKQVKEIEEELIRSYNSIDRTGNLKGCQRVVNQLTRAGEKAPDSSKKLDNVKQSEINREPVLNVKHDIENERSVEPTEEINKNPQPVVPTEEINKSPQPVVPTEEVNKNPQSVVPSATDKLNALRNDNFMRALGDEIWDIVKENVRPSVNSTYVIPRIVGNVMQAASRFNASYDKGKMQNVTDEKMNELMHDSMKTFFSKTFDSLEGCNMRTNSQVAVAQKICDIVLNKATVVGFNGEEYAKFSSNYALTDGSIVTEHLLQTRRGLNNDAIYEIVSEVRIELGVKLPDNPKIEEPKQEIQAENKEEKEPEDTVVEEPKTDQEIKLEEELIVEEPAVKESTVAEPIIEAPITVESKVEEPVAVNPVENKPVDPQIEESQTESEEAKYDVEQIKVTLGNFDELFNAATNNETLTAKVEAELKEILLASGAYGDDEENIQGIVQDIARSAYLIPEQYTYVLFNDPTKPVHEGTLYDVPNMGNFVYAIFRDVYEQVDKNRDIDTQIIETQKLTDVILKNYPPISHEREENGVYADNYITSTKPHLRKFLSYIGVPRSERLAHIESINNAVAKARPLGAEEKENPFASKEPKIKPKKKDDKKVNTSSPFGNFGEVEKKLTKGHEQKKNELQTVRKYVEGLTNNTTAISEDEGEYLENIEEENTLEETAIGSNENEIVAETPVKEEAVAESDNKQEEHVVEEISEDLNVLANNLVANVLGDAMAELEEEDRQKEEEEARRINEEEQKQNDAIVNSFVNDLFGNATADVEREQRGLEEERKLREEAKRKAEEEAKSEEQSQPDKNKVEEEPKVEEKPISELDALVAREIDAEKDAPSVNSVLYDRCGEAVNSTEVTERVANQLNALFVDHAEYGTARREFINKTADIKDVILSYYEESDYFERNLNTKAGVQGMAQRIFTEVYAKAENCGYDMPDRILLSQKATDVLMKNYSPAAFNPEKFADFTDNYLIRNQKVLRAAMKFVDTNGEYKWTATSDRIKADKALVAAYKAARSANQEKVEQSKAQCSALNENDIVNEATVHALKERFEFATVNTDEVTKFKASAMQIFKDSGIDRDVVDLKATILFDKVNYILPNVYDNLAKYAKQEATFDDMMSYVAKESYELCYNAVDKNNLSNDQKLALTQKLANLVVHSYSPVNFTDAVSNEKYTDFVSKDQNLVDSIVGKIENRKAEEKRLAEEKIAEEEAKKQAEIAREKAEEEAKREAEEKEARIANYIINSSDMSRFKVECEKRIKSDSSLRSSVKFQIGKILTNFGDNSSSTAEFVANMGTAGMLHAYNQINLGFEEEKKPNDLMDEFTAYAAPYVFAAMDSRFPNQAARVVLSQKIFDVLLKNYSPIAFADEMLDKYADNYFVNSPSAIEKYCKYRSHGNAAELINEIREYQNDPEKAMKAEGNQLEGMEIGVRKAIDPIVYDYFMNKANWANNNKNIQASANEQISGILTGYNIRIDQANTITKAIISNCVVSINATYKELMKNQVRNPEECMTTMMANIAPKILERTQDFVPQFEERMLLTESVMNVILKTYSPVAFTNGALDKYADNYFLDSDAALEKYCQQNLKGQNAATLKNSIIKYQQKILREEQRAREYEERMANPASYSKAQVVETETKIDLSNNKKVSKENIDFFKEQFEFNRGDREVSSSVLSQIEKILSDCGVKESKISSTVNNIHQRCISNLPSIYDKIKENEFYRLRPDDMMTEMISPLLDTINKATKGCYSSPEEQMVNNIGVLDVILKNYSPVAFTNGTLDKYANQLFLKESHRIDTFYGRYINDRSKYEDKAAFRERVVALHEKMKSQDAANKSDLTGNKNSELEKEKISVDLSTAAETKVDAPKTEAHQTAEVKVEESNTLKERMVINEFSANTSGNDVSAKVEENNVPVVSNVKE